MFEAFARAYGNTDHKYVRQRAVAWMLDNWDDLAPFQAAGDGPEHKSKEEYIEAMSTEGFWGDDLALNAVCGAFGVVVRVLKRVRPGEYLWLDAGHVEGDNVDPLLLYLANNHYENLFSYMNV